MSSRFWPLLLALLVIGALLLSQRQTLEKQADNPHATLNQFQQYRVGHDWVEPLPNPAPPPNSTARSLLEGRGDANSLFECTQPGCRTCQWMTLFGGEW